MKAVIQRVSYAKVETRDIKREIGLGLLILLGVGKEDDEGDIRWLSEKISRLRVFSDREGKMNLAVNDVGGSVMVISQFTLFASTKKGNRPSYILSAEPEKAKKMYRDFTTAIRTQIKGKTEEGCFGDHMKIELLNDGPVTIIIDTKNRT